MLTHATESPAARYAEAETPILPRLIAQLRDVTCPARHLPDARKGQCHLHIPPTSESIELASRAVRRFVLGTVEHSIAALCPLNAAKCRPHPCEQLADHQWTSCLTVPLESLLKSVAYASYPGAPAAPVRRRTTPHAPTRRSRLGAPTITVVGTH